MSQRPNEIEFFRELRSLLDRYNVRISATDDGLPHGMHSPFVEIEFSQPYAAYEFTEICAGDEPEHDVRCRTV